MRNRRWVLVIVAVLVGLVGSSLVVGGAVLTWAQVTQRDRDGFYTSPSYRLTTGNHAIVLEDVDLDLGRWPAAPVQPGQVATVRVTAQVSDEQAVFIGIASQSDIDRYLAGVAYDEVVDVDRSTVETRTVPGGAVPPPPGAQSFWVASTGGTGSQNLTWPIEDGRWGVVVMNLDGSPSLDLTVTAGARIAYLTPVALVLLGLGGLCLIGAAVLTRRPRRTPDPLPPVRPTERFPLTLTGTIDAVPGRWLWTVKWILVVPHVLVLTILWAVLVITTVAAGLSILLTQRYPRRLFDFNVGVLRWTWRVGHYSYLSLATDRYPPFTLAPVPYPATLELSYPERMSRWLVLVKWILAIPHLLIVGTVVGTTFGSTARPAIPLVVGGLIGILVVVVAVHLAVVRRYPDGLFDLVVGLNRWIFRVLSYLVLMTDVYPPFRLDLGGAEDGPPPMTTAESRPLATSAAP